MSIYYENPPSFCASYGIIGHRGEECRKNNITASLSKGKQAPSNWEDKVRNSRGRTTNASEKQQRFGEKDKEQLQQSNS